MDFLGLGVCKSYVVVVQVPFRGRASPMQGLCEGLVALGLFKFGIQICYVF